MKKKDFYLVALVVVCIVTCCLITRMLDAPVDDTNIKKYLMSCGYYCIGDNEQGSASGFLVTRTNVSRDDVYGLNRVNYNAPCWKGRAWIEPCVWSKERAVEVFVPDGSTILGDYYAAGDKILISEIETKLRNRR